MVGLRALLNPGEECQADDDDQGEPNKQPHAIPFLSSAPPSRSDPPQVMSAEASWGLNWLPAKRWKGEGIAMGTATATKDGRGRLYRLETAQLGATIRGPG